MRLRLVHSLSLLLLAAVALTALAMGTLVALNLRHGFSGYLRARDAEHLDQLAAIVEERVAADGGIASLHAGRGGMREFLDVLARREGLPVRPAPPPGAPPPPPGAPPPGAPPPEDQSGFGARVSLYDAAGAPIAGRPADGAYVERPIHCRGDVVAHLRLAEAPVAPDPVESSFLRDQYVGIAGVSLALLALAIACAWWFAKRWTRPLLDIQRATERIAQGALDVRLVAARGDELGDVTRNVNAMAASLQRLDGSRRRWLADVSHELRTPLTVLQGELEALADGVRPLDAAAIASLRDEALTLGRLVDDLHLLAMSDLQALPCRFAELDAAELVRQLAQRFAPRAAAAGIAVEVTGADTPLPARWDATRVAQLVGNLLENSVRYTDAPGRVRVAIARAGDDIAIEVDDSAPGVAAGELARLFEPLYRVDAARSRAHGGAGSGLGLAICDAIARAHGGTITATASPFGGVRIRALLPAQPRGAAA